MKNKLFLIPIVVVFGFIVSYIAFGWQEPSGTMPIDYTLPLTTLWQDQDISLTGMSQEQLDATPYKQVANLSTDYLDGYDSMDFLAETTSSNSNMVIPIKTSDGTPASCPYGWIDFGVLSKEGTNTYTRYCYKDSSIDGSPYNLDASINSPLIPEEEKTITVSFGGSSASVTASCNSGILDQETQYNVMSFTTFTLTGINVSQDLVCNFTVVNADGEISVEKIWPKPPTIDSIVYSNAYRYLTSSGAYQNDMWHYMDSDIISLIDVVSYSLSSANVTILPGYSSDSLSYYEFECFDEYGSSLGSVPVTSTSFPTGTVELKILCLSCIGHGLAFYNINL